MEKRELLHEGKAKRIYATDNSYYVVQEFKDTISAFDGAKKSVMAGKGEINNEISCYLFEYLNNYQIPTHFVQRLSATEMLVKKLEMIPIEVVMRNIAAGSLVKRYGIDEAKVLDYPIFELYLKDDERHDPMISESFTFALGHCTPE
ncbi:MAG: phosphoribosylaminoimidazolesuccinocarboxamide synthase, partial [FCB group bacterium]|nr:phosphoribosylaminoimidazolesuccinocarboxamide synthase [FCB group bacterium]